MSPETITGYLLERAVAAVGLVPRVIRDLVDDSPYLSRHYLHGKPRMPDGSHPFDERGDPKPGAITDSRFGLFLHRFHKSDRDRELHNHPFEWSVSLVLAAGYVEERLVDGEVVTRKVRPGRLNFIRNRDFHRVALIDGQEAWTLFLTGPKTSDWGFLDVESGTFTHWREYIKQALAKRTRDIWVSRAHG